MALSLAINDLDAGYGAVKALRGVSLDVEAGETVALLGTNGNGKSTLMKCVTGLVRPRRGSVSLTIDGNAHDLTKLSPEAIVDLGVALVPGGTAVVSQADGAGKSDARRVPQSRPPRHRSQPRARLRYVSGSRRSDRGQLAGTMSGGQQQMLAIARALMSSPRLLLIDEPSVGLSPLLVSQTITKIGELNRAFRPDGADGGAELQSGDPHRRSRLHHRPWRDRGRGQSVDELKGNDIVKRLYLGGTV